MKSKLIEEDRVAIAYALHDAGFKYQVSTSVADFTTAGYGELDQYGEFEYPLILSAQNEDLPFIDIMPWSEAKVFVKTFSN